MGLLAKMTKIFSDNNYNIGKMHNSRDIKKKKALCWFELDSTIDEQLITQLLEIDGIVEVKYINV